MKEAALEAFAARPEAEVVTVYEHGGWWMTFLPDGTVVNTANDQGQYSGKALEFRKQQSGKDWECIGEIRR
jgi:hypothetical protein